MTADRRLEALFSTDPNLNELWQVQWSVVDLWHEQMEKNNLKPWWWKEWKFKVCWVECERFMTFWIGRIDESLVRWSTNGAAFLRWETTLCLHLALLILGQTVLPWHVQARSAADPVGCRYRDSCFPMENRRKTKGFEISFWYAFPH